VYGNWLVDQVYGYLNTDHDPEPGNLILKAHSHRARLRPSASVHARRRASTDVDGRRRASTPIWNTWEKACAFTPSASTSVDGRRRAQNRTVLDFERVYVRRRT